MSAPIGMICGNIVSTLRARRRELGLSQETLGAQLGTNQQNMSVREAGLETPSLATLVRWARALDMDVRLVPLDGPEQDRRRRRRGA